MSAAFHSYSFMIPSRCIAFSCRKVLVKVKPLLGLGGVYSTLGESAHALVHRGLRPACLLPQKPTVQLWRRTHKVLCGRPDG